jgi:molybdopterin molybdotransferase
MSIIEPPVAGLMSVAQAIAVIDAEPVTPRIVSVPIEAVPGRRLATDVSADRDYPPFDKAVMDGFAIAAAAAAGDERKVIGTVHAGESAAAALAAGDAMAVMTGAPLPAGTLAVAPVEFTTRINDRIRIDRAVNAGQAIARRGSDAAAGRVLLTAGTIIGPAQIAVLASVGLAMVPVFDRPRVAVMSTGDELIPIDQAPFGAQIRNSNSSMIVALLRSLGCDAVELGIVRDDLDVLRDAIDGGSQSIHVGRAVPAATGHGGQCPPYIGFDALFVTGGMSMGERDFIPRLLVELGFESKIAKLRIKPGKPFMFATRGDRRVFGLPGNPVSAFVCTLRLAARLLRRLGGGPAGGDLIGLKLSTPLPANGPREFYLPAVRSGFHVTPLSPNGSADIFTLAAADVLIIRAENAPPAMAGEIAECLPVTVA